MKVNKVDKMAMSDRHRQILQKYLEKLSDELHVEPVASFLWTEAGILTLDDMDRVLAKASTSQVEASKILMSTLQSRGEQAFPKFVEALEKEQPVLACLLLREENAMLYGQVSTKETQSTAKIQAVDKQQGKNQPEDNQVIGEKSKLVRGKNDKGKLDNNRRVLGRQQQQKEQQLQQREQQLQEKEKHIHLQQKDLELKLKELQLQLKEVHELQKAQADLRRHFSVDDEEATGKVSDKPMDERHKKILKDVKLELVEDMNVEEVLLHMAKTHIFSERDEDEIKSKGNRREKCTALLETLPMRGLKAYSAFVTALENVHPHLANLVIEAENKN